LSVGGEDLDAGLKPQSSLSERPSSGCTIHRPRALFLDQAGQRESAIRPLDNDVVVVAAEGQVETEKHLKVLDLQRAYPQVWGRA